YIESQVYQAVVENSASEQAARMIAVKNAADNAGDIIDSRQLVDNKGRQAAIAQQISEIGGGAAAGCAGQGRPDRQDETVSYHLEAPTMSSGRIVQIIGAVIDVEFPRDQVPNVYDALKVVGAATTLEVQQQLGDGIV